jgi:hypothetical protein
MRGEFLDMNTTLEKQTRKPRTKPPVTVIVEREFVGERPFTEVLLPVLFEDMRRKAEQIRTLDNRCDTA